MLLHKSYTYHAVMDNIIDMPYKYRLSGDSTNWKLTNLSLTILTL